MSSSFQKMQLTTINSKEQFNLLLPQQCIKQIIGATNHNDKQFSRKNSAVESEPKKQYTQDNKALTKVQKDSFYVEGQTIRSLFLNKKQKTEQDITIPRYGKVSLQKLLQTQKSRKKSHENNKQKQRQPIQFSGYFRHLTLPLSQIIDNNKNNKVETSYCQHSTKVSTSESSFAYTPTQPDIQFLHKLREQYSKKLNNSYQLSTKTFIDIIISCEQTFHKKKSINLETSTAQSILLSLEFKLPSKLATLTTNQKLILSEMFKQVIEYWRKIKVQKHKKFPILRHLWPKTQFQLQKYSYFIPYKSRTLTKDKQDSSLQTTNQNEKQRQTLNNNSYSHKYAYKSSSIRNKLGRTERQTKISRQSKDLSIFYGKVNQMANENKDLCEQSEKQIYSFHKKADELYGMNRPSWWGYKFSDQFQNVMKEKIKIQKMCGDIDKLKDRPYYSNPIVRIYSHSKAKISDIYNEEPRRQFNIFYDPKKNQIQILSNTEHKRNNKKVKKSLQ